MPLNLVLAAILLALASAGLAALTPRGSVRGQRGATLLMALSMIAGLAGVAAGLAGRVSVDRGLPWQAAGGGSVGLDALSAFFLMPIFLMGGSGSIYGLGYWSRASHPDGARRVEVFWGLLVAGLALLVIARQALSFLLGWELMALSAFFLVGAEDGKVEARRASLIYLVATHVGTLVLFAFFVIWRELSGSFELSPLASGMASEGGLALLFVLALFAFGLKAGLLPLHFWLPGAHAAAPSHVSAMLSGVVLKMGVYGLLRFLLLMGTPPLSWGLLILALGALSALIGVAFALGQHDLKRLLAYHSVENIGIIFMGMGLGLVGQAKGEGILVALGFGGCLLHVWNHSLFKPLLFLGAGAVHHEARTREIDLLGGLAKSMPKTAATFLVGAVAICGLPPLNGFVSELLIYLGLFRALSYPGVTGAVALAAPILAMTGALALACFVKAYGAVFLGLPRSPAAAAAREVPLAMRFPMWVMAGACAAIGLAPRLVAPILDAVTAPWMAAMAGAAVGATASTLGDSVGAAGGTDAALGGIEKLAPLRAVGAVSIALALASVLVLVAVRQARRRARRAPGTWDCGYAAPSSRMQYSSSSFGRSVVALFSWALRPREEAKKVMGDFPGPASLATHVDDAVLDRALLPAYGRLERVSVWFRRFQQGLAQHYILYILITLMILLATGIPFGDIAQRLFAR